MPDNNLLPELVKRILAQYPLDQNGIHGITHWGRVLENGRRLALLTHARLPVIEMFALFHDSRRRNDCIDLGHGKRGAEFAVSLRDEFLTLPDEDFSLLYLACEHHTDQQTHPDVTVQTCWDADRLDLWRAQITVKPERLCTLAAREAEILNWAEQRSKQRACPESVLREWGQACPAY